MPERDIHRAIQGKARFRLTKETNLGTIQGFPQLKLIKQELKVKTLGELAEKSSRWLISNGVSVDNLKRFLLHRGYTLQFHEEQDR